MRPANKGLKLPAESLDLHEVNALLRAFGSSRTDVRNYAMVMLMYAVGLRIGEIVALERRHFHNGRHKLVVPATARLPERSMALDASTQEALERWIEARRAAKIPAAAPLFCTITAGAKGHRLHTSYIRELLKAKATSLGLDRRVTPEGLRRSGRDHRQHSQRRIDAQVGRYLDEVSFRVRYPSAYERWQSALDLFDAHPQRHTTRIGHVVETMELVVSFIEPAHRLMFRLLAATGMRRSELLALEGRHLVLDADQPYVKVRQRVRRRTGVGLVIGPPKSRYSRRDLPITRALADQLLALTIAPRDFVFRSAG